MQLFFPRIMNNAQYLHIDEPAKRLSSHKTDQNITG